MCLCRVFSNSILPRNLVIHDMLHERVVLFKYKWWFTDLTKVMARGELSEKNAQNLLALNMVGITNFHIQFYSPSGLTAQSGIFFVCVAGSSQTSVYIHKYTTLWQVASGSSCNFSLFEVNLTLSNYLNVKMINKHDY